MFSKFELYGMGLSIAVLALAVYLVQVENIFFRDAQPAQAIQATQSDIVVVPESDNKIQAQADALYEASDKVSTLNRMVIDDIAFGSGDQVEEGATVVVHYVGKLQNGQEFDNSEKRGAPFTFTVGEGQVIEGWDKGLVGMQVGGKRILVIPPDMAYGAAGIGPIPGNATLVFSIELLEIK